MGTYLDVSFQPFRKLWSFLVFLGILERADAAIGTTAARLHGL